MTIETSIVLICTGVNLFILYLNNQQGKIIQREVKPLIEELKKR